MRASEKRRGEGREHKENGGKKERIVQPRGKINDSVKPNETQSSASVDGEPVDHLGKG